MADHGERTGARPLTRAERAAFAGIERHLRAELGDLDVPPSPRTPWPMFAVLLAVSVVAAGTALFVSGWTTGSRWLVLAGYVLTAAGLVARPLVTRAPLAARATARAVARAACACGRTVARLWR